MAQAYDKIDLEEVPYMHEDFMNTAKKEMGSGIYKRSSILMDSEEEEEEKMPFGVPKRSNT